jgi:hypothetical protein
VVPGLTVIVAGLKAKFLMLTVFVATALTGPADDAALDAAAGVAPVAVG